MAQVVDNLDRDLQLLEFQLQDPDQKRDNPRDKKL